ncbi:MAG: hypothetical protein ABFC88_12985 [Thermoguttaceae bacterium]
MKTKKCEDGWWVIDLPMGCDDCGPYPTKDAAEETMRGLKRTFDNWDDHSFFTCEKRGTKDAHR